MVNKNHWGSERWYSGGKLFLKHRIYAVLKEQGSSIQTLVHAGNVGQCARLLAGQGEDVCAISSTPKYI